MPGRPDVALPASRKAIFVNGCFWHAHGCSLSRDPDTAREFWRTKFERNKERDARKLRELKQMGWKTLVVWECECTNEDKLRLKLKRFAQS